MTRVREEMNHPFQVDQANNIKNHILLKEVRHEGY